MPTNPRIQVSFNQIDFEIISILSKKNKVSKSTFVKKIIEYWLEKNKKKFLREGK